MACFFCDNQSSPELVADFAGWTLLLNSDSAVRGHAMLVARRHVENFGDLTDAEAQEFARIEKVCERALLDVTGTDRAILVKLGIVVPHLHIHIYPVSSRLGREDVDRILAAQVSEEREPGFAKSVRDRMTRLT